MRSRVSKAVSGAQGDTWTRPFGVAVAINALGRIVTGGHST